MSGYKNQTFDDRDTDHLKYQGDWFLTGSYNATSVGESGTLSSTKDLNANVTFTFPVPAIAFYYYGIGRCCGGLYGICIDCYPDRPNYTSIDALNQTDDGGNPPTVLFWMRFKTPGIHEIIIRNENDTRVVPSGNSQLTIDRIILEVVDDTSPSTPASSSTTSSLYVNPTSSSSPSGSQSTSPHSHPIGSLVGGAVGGGFVLVLILSFLFWSCLRRRRKASATSIGPSSVPPSAYASSLPPSTIVAPAMVVAQNSSTFPTITAQYPGRYGYAPRPRKGGKGAQDHFLPPSVSTLSALSSSQSPSPPSSNRPRREQDAGPLPVDTEEPTLPPEYDQVFSRTICLSNIPPG